ncbi:AAA family ATPase [Sphingobacterium daejeonense]|uniref:AAA family ATPase n=1 Tax=Sphingobacterium daejeonense TaxID=371142 RepID=UPI00374468A9
MNHVNITAILGKNGAGKSTLLELLYLLLYSLSERKEFLQDRSNNSRFIEKRHLADYYEQQNKKIDEILEVSQMELFL